MRLLQFIYNKFLNTGLHAADRSRLVNGVLQSILIQGVSLVLVFAGNWLLVNFFGANKYGVYVHVFNWVSILSMLVLGGQDDVVLSRLPKYKAQNNPGHVGALIKKANVRVALSGIVITGVFLLLLHSFPIPTLSEYRSQFLAAGLAIYLSAFLTINQNILQALNHIRLSQVIERLLKPFLFMAFILVAGWLSMGMNSNRLIGIGVINLGICAVVLCWLMIKKTRYYLGQGVNPYRGVALRKQSSYFLAISLLYLLTGKTGMLLMPYFLEEKAIGIFNISARFADLIIYPFFLLHTVLPQLFAVHHDAARAYKQKLYTEATLIIMVISIPLLLVNVLAGKWLLGYFGEAFTAGYPALVYMSISNGLFALFGPANTILMMQGREKQAAIALLVYVLLLIATSWWLIPTQGITGAALAMLISHGCYNLLLAVYVKRYTGVLSPLINLLVKRRGE